MKRIFSYLIAFFIPLYCIAQQETVVIKRRLTGNIKEHISVLKSDNNIRDGLYQALDGKVALATGRYTNNLKTGVWSFNDPANRLIQRFNFTSNTLLYEAPEDSTTNCRYVVDDSIRTGDRTTKPLVIGGRYFGYVNYVKLFMLPPDMKGIDNTAVVTTMELLVSPGGRLADYVVHFQAPTTGFDRKVSYNIDLLSDEDKTFVPATINGNPVACRIFVRCFLTAGGNLDLY